MEENCHLSSANAGHDFQAGSGQSLSVTAPPAPVTQLQTSTMDILTASSKRKVSVAHLPDQDKIQLLPCDDEFQDSNSIPGSPNFFEREEENEREVDDFLKGTLTGPLPVSDHAPPLRKSLAAHVKVLW